jgi:hypothetical protein
MAICGSALPHSKIFTAILRLSLTDCGQDLKKIAHATFNAFALLEAPGKLSRADWLAFAPTTLRGTEALAGGAVHTADPADLHLFAMSEMFQKKLSLIIAQSTPSLRHANQENLPVNRGSEIGLAIIN